MTRLKVGGMKEGGMAIEGEGGGVQANRTLSYRGVRTFRVGVYETVFVHPYTSLYTKVS